MASVPVDRQALDTELADQAVALARRLLETSERTATRGERRQRARLGRMLEDPDGRELLFALTDEVMRIDDHRRAARRFASIVAEHRSRSLPAVDRALLAVGGRLAPLMPAIVMPLVRRRIAAETRGVVLPADDPAFARYVARRRRSGVRLNINPLGEAVLSDVEADSRLAMVLERIARPDVDYVSVKVSAIVANLDSVAFAASVDRVCERLRVVYRAAAAAEPPTFVNLDMEEYRDLELTVTAFMKVLGESEFEAIDAGIVLQAYLPESHAVLDTLGAWASDRHRRAGGSIKIRIVKGANLSMEHVEAELHGWTAAPYPTKADVDASYKALLESALRGQPDWAPASMRVGLASHNLFDVAWGLVLARHIGAVDRLELEMLEGMAPAQSRAAHAEAGSLLLYAPVVADRDFAASISYLSRRLDENTQPENFLRALFTLRPDTPAWREQERRFRTAVSARHAVSHERRRWPVARTADRPFRNEPDSDFTDPDVRARLEATSAPNPTIERIVDPDQIDDRVVAASRAFGEWSRRTPLERRATIRAGVEQMRRGRFESIAVMGRETGKTVREADPEVSEAIDFGEYYSGPGIDLLELLAADGLRVGGRGVVLVCGPWNFPYAIPAGGVLAALAAGNAVLLKPAPESVAVAAVFIEQLHRGGIPRDLAQLVVCEDGPVGRHLVTHPGVDTVILTGGLATAEMFLDWDPAMRLYAETSGKNALVITAAADLDLAIADLVRSAFGHAGQKCSAASVAVVEASLYDDPDFLARLRHTVESWKVGWPDDRAAMIGPIIKPPAGALERALSQLEPSETWLVEPKLLDGSGRLWRPGVRLGVDPGSWFHRTECFGPVLGVIRANDLDHAIDIQNDSEFGLTGGIHSLDPDEVARWIDAVEVGNAYVNRATTGAVVQRQPFGGWKHSSVGPGAKAGGPSYVLQFARLDEPTPATLEAVRASYEMWWRSWFGIDHDPTGLSAESNVLRHRPVERVVVWHAGEQAALDRLRAGAAVTGVALVELDARERSEQATLAALRPGDRLRIVSEPSRSLLRGCVERGIWFSRGMPSPHGRVELMLWVREQAISRTLHRHGRLP